MSAVIQRNHEGVVLRYADPSVLRPHHVEQKLQPSDRVRMDLLRAERAFLTILVMGENVFSDIAMTRYLDELRAIQRALNHLDRRQLGMAPAEGEAV